MPIGISSNPSGSIDDQEQAAPDLPISNMVAAGSAIASGFRSWETSARAMGAWPGVRGALNTMGQGLEAQGAGVGAVTGLPPPSGPAPAMAPKISSEQANERYGGGGLVRFNAPVYEDDAAYRLAAAQREQFTQNMMDRSNLSPLEKWGANLAGTIVNPMNIGMMALTDGLAGVATEAIPGLGAAAETGANMTRLGRLASKAPGIAVEGALAQTPFVAQSLADAQYEEHDYTAGDALMAIATGMTLHGLAAGGAVLFKKLPIRTPGEAPAGEAGAPGVSEPPAETAAGEPPGGPPGAPPAAPGEVGPGAIEADGTPAWVHTAEGESAAELVPPSTVPDLVNDQTSTSRAALTVLAIEKHTIGEGMDENVNLAELADRQAHPDSLPRLDETTMAPQFDSWRPMETSQAVTTHGQEVPVRYGLAEIGDLATSHDDDFLVNGQYPAELQPRARERAGAQVRNLKLEEELNPKLLMRDLGAGAGAPIIGPDGVVESGNGRMIALRRSARRGSPAYQRYLAELEAQGFNIAGMKEPVLVRMRTEPMGGAERAVWAREANADVTERMSLTEQATSDARHLDPETLAALGEDDAGGRRRFAKTFLTRVAPDQVNSLVDEHGHLTQDGQRRIDAALMAKAYGDPGLVEAVFEDAEPNIKAIGQALRTAAPTWAAMRAGIARGEISPHMDLTPALREAVNLVRHLRDKGLNVREGISERLARRDLFLGDSIGVEAEGFLRLFFAKDFARPYGAAKVADVLLDYARAASEEGPTPNMYGELADESTARQIFANAYRRERGPLELTVRPPGEPPGPKGGAIRDPVVSVSETGGDGERPGGEGLPESGGRPAGGDRGRPGGAAPDNEPAADAGRPGPGAGGEPAAGVGAGTEGGDVGRPGAPGLKVSQTGDEIVSADPELKAYSEDTARAALANGVELPPDPKADPNTIAKAMEAAAVCTAEELEL